MNKPNPSEASNRASFSDAMNRWRVPVTASAPVSSEAGRERERAASEGRVQQNQSTQRIQQQLQPHQTASQRAVNVPSSVLAAYQAKPHHISLDRSDERRRSESHTELAEVPTTFFTYDSNGRSLEPSDRQAAHLHRQERSCARQLQVQPQPQPPLQAQQPQPRQAAALPSSHTHERAHASSPPEPTQRASARATPTQSSVSHSISSHQNSHRNVLVSPVDHRSAPPTPPATAQISIPATHPSATPTPPTPTSAHPRAHPDAHTTKFGPSPLPPAPAHPVVIKNAAKALAPIRHLYETAWTQTVANVQAEMARMHAELVGVIERERAAHNEMAVEYARVREERERAGEEARRLGMELERVRGRMERMNGEMVEMRAALERARQVQGGQREREGEAEREREMSVRAELEMAKAQLEERTKELEVERVLRYNAEKKLRDVQTVTARIFSTPESDTESPGLKMQVDTDTPDTNIHTRRGSECESASTVVGTPDSDCSPSLKLKHYQPQLARFEPDDPSRSRNQGQDHFQLASYVHERPREGDMIRDRDGERTRRNRVVRPVDGVSDTSTAAPTILPIATRSSPFTPAAPRSKPHTRQESISVPPKASPAPQNSPTHADAHPHQQHQQPIATKTRPRADSDVEGQRWHRPQAVPLPANEKEGEETVVPGYGNVSVSRRHPPSPSSLPRPPPLSHGESQREDVIDLTSGPTPAAAVTSQPQPPPQPQAHVTPALHVDIPLPPASHPPAPPSVQSPAISNPRWTSVRGPTEGQGQDVSRYAPRPRSSEVVAVRGEWPPMARLSRPGSPASATQPQQYVPPTLTTPPPWVAPNLPLTPPPTQPSPKSKNAASRPGSAVQLPSPQAQPSTVTTPTPTPTPATVVTANTTMNAMPPIPNPPPPVPPPTHPFAHYVWPLRVPVQAQDPRTLRPTTAPVTQAAPPRRALTTPGAPLPRLESNKTAEGETRAETTSASRKRDRREYEGEGEGAGAGAVGGADRVAEEQHAGRGRAQLVRSSTEPNGERARQRMRMQMKLEEGEIVEEPGQKAEGAGAGAGAREGVKRPEEAKPVALAEGKSPVERKAKTGASVKTPVRNKIGINHMDLLYEMKGGQLICRMCRSTDNGEAGTKPMVFPAKASWPELVGHCQMAHPKSCEDLERLSPSQVAELRQRLTSSKMTGLVLR
ncbi:hypothetical protein LshimejAT787_0100620 [Lyophyllum shimeji]|uniref:Uncharacterized protein n=1 Tax=Lyophyllum shimeji TaxID=47721 RepID=A0A9P3UHR0_LYOSH|nr:hypothetical protein LshimejAT787_0100620 [Lyophyllum shimeji]